MAITARSPWGAIVRTPLLVNSIFSSPPFMPQVPDRAGLSPFLSWAVAARPARARTPQASTTPYPNLRVVGTMTFDPPFARETVAAELATYPMAARAEARGIY